MLRELFLRGGRDLHPLVKQNRAAGGGPLIDGENVFHRNPFDYRLGVTVSDDVEEGSKNLALRLGHSHRSRVFHLKSRAVFKYQNGVAVVQTHFGYQIKHRARTGLKQIAIRVTFRFKCISPCWRNPRSLRAAVPSNRV